MAMQKNGGVGNGAVGGPLVFVVDADPSVADSLRLLLQQHGCRTEIFTAALNVLERLQHVHPDLLITDMTPGDIDGVDFIRQVQAQDSHVAVIAMGRTGDVARSVEAIRSGAYNFLEKPFLQAPLLRDLRHLFPGRSS
jgi:two-component system C4-dicarboxylate transport response regulator DctD